MKTVLVTRPAPDAEETEAEIRRLGFDVLCDPVLAITPRPWVSPEWENISGIIITSKNAMAGFAGHAMPKHKPYYVVGERTAQALRALGLVHVTGTVERSDDLPALLRLQNKPENSHFVHLTAAHSRDRFYETVRAEGYRLDSIVVYEAVAAEALRAETVAALKKQAVDYVTFYSARSAEIFHEMAARAGVVKLLKGVSAICLSEAVAESCARDLWKEVRAAVRPTQKHMLECLAEAGR